MLYIAYGSNLHRGQMKHRCPTATVVGPTELKGYDLLFRGSRHSAVATVEHQEKGSVPALLWDIKGRDELSLDRYEGFPNFYHKELKIVEFQGEHVPAMLYVMNGGHRFGEPSQTYYNTIREGYKSAGFDPQFLDNAVKWSEEQAMEHDRKQIREWYPRGFLRDEDMAAAYDEELDQYYDEQDWEEGPSLFGSR